MVVSYCAKLHSDQKRYVDDIRPSMRGQRLVRNTFAGKADAHAYTARPRRGKGVALRRDPVAVRAGRRGWPAPRYFESLHPHLGAYASSGGPFSTGQQRIAARARLPTTYALAQPEAADHTPRGASRRTHSAGIIRRRSIKRRLPTLSPPGSRSHATPAAWRVRMLRGSPSKPQRARADRRCSDSANGGKPKSRGAPPDAQGRRRRTTRLAGRLRTKGTHPPKPRPDARAEGDPRVASR